LKEVAAVRPEEESESEGEVDAKGVYEGVMGERIRAEKSEEEIVKNMADPRKPTDKEVETHNLTHLPYRNWCAVCVRAKGKDLDHRRDARGPRGLPEFSFDYCFPGDEFGYKLTILIGRERTTGMTMATVVPEKGSKGKFVSDKVMEFFAECGCTSGDVIVKSDQEAAIAYLVKDIVFERGDEQGCRTIVEESPVQSSGSNGVVERAVQTIEGQVRVLKLGLEEKIGAEIAAGSNVVAFMAEYAAYLVNRMEVGKDGKTAMERNKGKKATVMGVEFGEKVLYKKKAGQKMEKINPRWDLGIFVGVRNRSGEFMISTMDGIKKVRSIRRMALQDRWTADSVQWVRFVPWNRYKDDDGADGDIPEGEEVAEPVRREQGGGGDRRAEGPEVTVRTRQPPPRAFQIRKEDAERHGYTRGCAGCSSWFRGLGRQPHTEACRERFQEALKDTARYQEAGRRKAAYDDKMQGKAAKKMRKQEAEKEAEKRPEATTNHDEKAEDDQMEKRRKVQVQPQAEEEEEMKAEDEMKRPREDNCEDLVKRVRRRGQEPVGSSSAAAAYNYEEMEVENVKKKWADIEDDDEGDEWIEEMWGKGWEEERKEEEVEDECEQGIHYAWDDVNDQYLPMEKVREARKEEMEHMKGKTFVVVKTEEAWRVTGKAPITTKWVDTDKSHGQGEMQVRSRWVARDFKAKGEKDREDLFSATPPLELFRYALSRQATRSPSDRERKSMYLDVKKAHLIPKCNQDVYVELPAEAEVQADECGKLDFWLYGCRPAAQAWEEHYSGLLKGEGFRRSQACPVAFAHETRDLIGIVHGDDFMFVGPDEDLDYIWEVLNKNYEIKNRGRLGSGKEDKKEIDMLGRTIKYQEWGLSWEGDSRHRKLLMEYFGMNGDTKALVKNGYKEDETVGGDRELGEQDMKAYRMLAARLNYMSQDNPTVQYSSKECCRKMAKPMESDFGRVKKLIRFMMGQGTVVWEYPWQEFDGVVKVYTDSDWAGCLRTRRSTSGGLAMLGRHPLKTWSATQPVVATSSCEAELYSASEGAGRGLALQTMLSELGEETSLQLYLDSSAAKGFASTRGLGRMRHVEVKDLWLQGAVHKGRLKLFKVRGEVNPADVMTKYLDRAAVTRLLARVCISVGQVVRDDRAEGGCQPLESDQRQTHGCCHVWLKCLTSERCEK
jgi:hypothetical protein